MNDEGRESIVSISVSFHLGPRFVRGINDVPFSFVNFRVSGSQIRGSHGFLFFLLPTSARSINEVSAIPRVKRFRLVITPFLQAGETHFNILNLGVKSQINQS